MLDESGAHYLTNLIHYNLGLKWLTNITKTIILRSINPESVWEKRKV